MYVFISQKINLHFYTNFNILTFQNICHVYIHFVRVVYLRILLPFLNGARKLVLNVQFAKYLDLWNFTQLLHNASEHSTQIHEAVDLTSNRSHDIHIFSGLWSLCFSINPIRRKFNGRRCAQSSAVHRSALCSNCVKFHKSNKLSSHHEILSISEISEDSQNMKTKLISSFGYDFQKYWCHVVYYLDHL
jgi:hypothetical protein